MTAILHHPGPHPESLDGPEHRYVLRLHHADSPVRTEVTGFLDHPAEQLAAQALVLPAVLDQYGHLHRSTAQLLPGSGSGHPDDRAADRRNH